MEMLYKINDVAKVLNISASYLYKKAEEGTIGSVKIGSALRFSKKNIDEYLEKCSRAPIAPQIGSK
jgi:excisionase family DNA binding protein